MEQVDTGQVYRGDLDRLLLKINADRGLDLAQYRRPYIERRIATRLRALSLHTYRQYIRHLEAHPEEYVALLQTLTINVTDFFRDAAVYRVFQEQVIPRLAKEKAARRQRVLRVWSAGCATGEEAYSLVMCFMEALGPSLEDFLLTVVGTDIDERALKVAKAAEYEAAKMAHVPKRHQVRYLERQGDRYVVRPEVRGHVKFKVLNLFDDRPMKVMDVVFCRNVFIYFEREQQERLLDSFCNALSCGGYLVLGRSEKMASSMLDRFELISGRERIYRKP